MKKRSFLLIVLAGLIIVSIFGQTPANDPHWNRIWEDEFLNLNNWYSYDHVHNVDKDISVLLTKNISVNNGKLVIQALEEDYFYNGKLYHYTSGSVTNYSPGMHFGYIEAKMKLPYGRGLWPSFWTYQNAANPSNAAEIDIFEMQGYNTATTMGTNLHMYYCDDISGCQSGCGEQLFEQCCPECDNRVRNYSMDVSIPTYPNRWLTYAIEWTPTKFIWYVNDVAVRNFPNPGIFDPVRIIIGMGICHWCPPNNTTPFPAKMEIEYVRLYELECDKNTVVTQISNFDTYNYAVKKSISLSSTTIMSQSSKIFLRATNFIELKNNFEVPLGAELYLDITSCD